MKNMEGTSTSVTGKPEQHSFAKERLAGFDFHSVSAEYEFISEHGPQSQELFDACKKHPGHDGFIPVSEFKAEHLPTEWRHKWMMDYIKCCADLTVKVDVKDTSRNRPDHFPGKDKKYPFSDKKGPNSGSRCGTGYIIGGDYYFHCSPCPCPECVESRDAKNFFWEVFIHTSSHVIFDSYEAASSVFQLFYDSKDTTENVKRVYGRKCLYDDSTVSDTTVNDPDSRTFDKSFTDKNCVMGITHDANLIKKLDVLQKQRIFHVCNLRKKLHKATQETINTAVVISHPHGISKYISVGKLLHIAHGITVNAAAKHRPSVDDTKNILKKGQLFRICPTGSDNSMQCSDGQSLKSDNPTAKETVETFGEQSSKICSFLLIPGHNYTLPFDIKFILPPNASYSWTCQFDLKPWRTFPPGTTFVNNETGELYNFSPKAEFYMNSSELPFFLHTHPDNKDNDNFNYCLIYDTPTCNGSSGAGIIDFGFHSFLLNHEGALSDGTSKSGEKIDLPTVRDYNCAWSLSEHASLFQLDRYVMFTTPDTLLFLFGVNFDHLKKDEERGPIVAIDDNDDDILSFVRWRLRRRLKNVPFDKLRLTHKMNNQMQKVHARHRLVSPNDPHVFVDGEEMDDDDYDDDEADDGNAANNKRFVNVRKKLYDVFIDTQADTQKRDALAYVLEIGKGLKDDNVDAAANDKDTDEDDEDDDGNAANKRFVNVRNKLYDVFIDTHADEQKSEALAYVLENDEGDDEDIDDDNTNDYGYQGIQIEDDNESNHSLDQSQQQCATDIDKIKKRKKWSMLLARLRDEEAERRMIELYAKHSDPSFSLSHGSDGENIERDDSDDDTFHYKREMFEKKVAHSMKNNPGAWNKIEYHMKTVDQSFLIWEEDDDNEDTDDNDNCIVLKRTKDSLKRRLMNKLKSIDEGELEWDEIRRLELIVCPPKKERMGHGLDFLLDAKFQRSIRYILGVGCPPLSEETHADEEEYPILNQLFSMYLKRMPGDTKLYPKQYIHPRLFNLLTTIKKDWKEWSMVMYYISTIDPSFNFLKENLIMGL